MKNTMPKHKRYIRSEEEIKDRLKKHMILLFAIPLTLLLVFLLFGPTIGALFGFLSKYRGVTGQEDTIAPPPPIFKDVPSAVKDTTMNLEGFAEPGATVTLFVNGPQAGEALASGEGTFLFENVALINGRNSIFAKAIDGSGNEGEKSQTLSIAVDNDKPKIEISSPKDNETVANLNNRITITGSVNEKVELKINDKYATLRPDNTFEYSLGVSEGMVTIKITATDEAGNSATEEITVKYENRGS